MSNPANTTIFAISIGIRRGTASSDALITPVEYSLVITRMPSTQIVSWPSPIPAPRMKPTGSVVIATSPPPDPRLPQLATTSAVRPAVSPTVSTTNKIRVQSVERTDLILVHSASISPPNAARRLGGSAAALLAGAEGDVVVMADSPAAR